MKKVVILLTVALAFASCDLFAPQKAKTTSVEQPKDGTYIQKKHFNNDPSSPVEWKVSLKKDADGVTMRDGESIRYSKSGKVYERINYVNNKKEGTRYTYHSNGEIWKEQEYVNGKLSGVCKRYDRKGLLTAEYHYKGGLVGTGLKEFTNLGKERPMPVLKIQKIDKIRESEEYFIKASLVGKGSDRIKSVDFYTGDLIEGRYYHENLNICNKQSGNTGTFGYRVPYGTILNKTFNIVAVATMDSGMKLILQDKVSVAVRGV